VMLSSLACTEVRSHIPIQKLKILFNNLFKSRWSVLNRFLSEGLHSLTKNLKKILTLIIYIGKKCSSH